MQPLKNIYHLLSALLAACLYRFPGKSMTVIGITGTDGKTSTTHMITHILKTAGLPSSFISTVEAKIGDQRTDTGLHVTTPSPFRLQQLMSQAKKAGSRYLVLEVTSHALDQFRAYGSSIDIALITNISHEHIDYHKNLQNYINAKAKILTGAQYAILNKDDRNFSFLKKRVRGRLVTYAKKKADFTFSDFEMPQIPFGEFNKYNMLAAACVAVVVGVNKKTIEKALKSLPEIPGRLEEIKSSKKFRIFIDFAHKPNALEQVLTAVSSFTPGKIIAVFGCAGLRDRLKRPMMGEIAAQMADYTILTAEDPRTEDARAIINQIAQGLLRKKIAEAQKSGSKYLIDRSKKSFFKIADRQEAINFALKNLAKGGDTVVICGKGHEKSMCYQHTEYPWDETLAVNKALYGPVKNTYRRKRH